jgi:hypothetical protein
MNIIKNYVKRQGEKNTCYNIKNNNTNYNNNKNYKNNENYNNNNGNYNNNNENYNNNKNIGKKFIINLLVIIQVLKYFNKGINVF